jgi:hypothetical protein
MAKKTKHISYDFQVECGMEQLYMAGFLHVLDVQLVDNYHH